MNHESSVGQKVLLSAAIVLGSFGLFLSVLNALAGARDEDFSFVFGAVLLGIGLGLALLASMKRQFQRVRAVDGAAVLTGAVIAGWALGGGVDELLREQDVTLLLAGLFLVLGAALAAGAWIRLVRRAQSGL